MNAFTSLPLSEARKVYFSGFPICVADTAAQSPIVMKIVQFAFIKTSLIMV